MHLVKELEDNEKRFDALLNLKEPVPITEIEFLKINKKEDAVALVMLSDWHFEEKVEARTINGLNEYNLDVARQRFAKCVTNSLKLVSKERASSEIRTLVLWAEWEKKQYTWEIVRAKDGFTSGKTTSKFTHYSTVAHVIDPWFGGNNPAPKDVDLYFLK